MKINEFLKNYDLHDSLLEKIKYDKTTDTIQFIIDFCYWQQENYKSDMEETGMIIVEFSGDTHLIYDSYEINSDDIIKVSSNANNTITIIVFNDLSDEYKEITIKANDVKVKKYYD